MAFEVTLSFDNRDEAFRWNKVADGGFRLYETAPGRAGLLLVYDWEKRQRADDLIRLDERFPVVRD